MAREGQRKQEPRSGCKVICLPLQKAHGSILPAPRAMHLTVLHLTRCPAELQRTLRRYKLRSYTLNGKMYVSIKPKRCRFLDVYLASSGLLPPTSGWIVVPRDLRNEVLQCVEESRGARSSALCVSAQKTPCNIAVVAPHSTASQGNDRASKQRHSGLQGKVGFAPPLCWPWYCNCVLNVGFGKKTGAPAVAGLHSGEGLQLRGV